AAHTWNSLWVQTGPVNYVCQGMGSEQAPVWSRNENWIGGSPAGDPEADLVIPNTWFGSGKLCSCGNDLPGISIRSIRYEPTSRGNFPIGGGDSFNLSGDILSIGDGLSSGGFLDVGGPFVLTGGTSHRIGGYVVSI